MYHMVFGTDHAQGATALLAILGFASTSEVGRYRDAWVEKDSNGEPVIAIYTRNGGGNREHYSYAEPPVSEGPECDCTGCVGTYRLPAHPLYIRDRDDDFDYTYATFYFKAPAEFRDALLNVASDEPVDMSEKWHEAIDALKGN